jgi:hypothetical protein
MSAPTVQELATEATLIFRGTVLRPGATTMATVPASDSLAVVRVDEVLESPGSLADLTGAEVTVQFSDASPGADSEAIFFTRPWLYGDSVAVIEIGREDVGGRRTEAAGDVQEQVTEVTRDKPDRALRGRLGGAGAVVAGTVINTRAPVPLTGRVTEHDPGLQVAVIAVESVELGELAGPTVEVAFHSSVDVMYFRSPKLQVGKEGIWLLRRAQATGAADVPAEWTCFDPEDELPKAQIGRVRGIVEAIRGDG